MLSTDQFLAHIAPNEQLQLETSSLSLTDTINMRRLIYIQAILERPEFKFIRDIYEAPKADPVQIDWCLLVQEDMADLNPNYTDQEIRKITKACINQL